MARKADPTESSIPEAVRIHAPIATVIVATLAGLLGGAVWTYLRPTRPDVVFVRTSEVMARYKVAVKARETFQRDTSAWAEESKQLESQLGDLAKTAKPKDEKAMEQARQLRSRLQALREKGSQRDQELMAPVLAEVNAGIKKFAQKHGYRMVLGTLQGGVILHGEDAADVTESLLIELNK